VIFRNWQNFPPKKIRSQFICQKNWQNLSQNITNNNQFILGMVGLGVPWKG
jgi:hypothetical protein